MTGLKSNIVENVKDIEGKLNEAYSGIKFNSEFLVNVGFKVNNCNIRVEGTPIKLDGIVDPSLINSNNANNPELNNIPKKRGRPKGSKNKSD